MRKKTRLTITLPPKVLDKVDSIVDNKTVFNRSHAIEKLIEQGFTDNVDTAVILAGGNKITDMSQVLKKVGDKYLLSIMIDTLKKYNFTRIVICSGSNIGEIKNIFKNGSDYGIKIDYVQENTPMGTAGVLKLAEKKIGLKNFLVMYGDILTDINFSDFIDFHFSEGRIATIGIKPRMGQKKYGQVLIQGNEVVSYSSKETNVGLSLVSTGLYVFSNEIFKYIKPGVQSYLGRDVFPALITDSELSAFVFQGIWYDISADDDYKQAQSRW